MAKVRALIFANEFHLEDGVKMASKEHEELVAVLKEVVAASDRTNHAVRAIVLPSTIMLIALLISLPLVLLSFVLGLVSVVFAGLVLGAGGVLAIIAQLKETKASEIPQPLEELAPSRVVETATTPSAPKTFVLPGSANAPHGSGASGARQ
jgi:hypothetical protein